MTAAAWLEMRLALMGTLRLARGDRGGLVCFDPSLEGFWRSFRAAVVAYPLYLVLLGLRLSQGDLGLGPLVLVVIVKTIAYVMSWTAFPLAVLPLARWLDREPRLFGFMVVYNWSQLPQTALFVVVALLPAEISQWAELVVTIALLVFEWYIARVTLDVNGAGATAVVLIDLVLGVLIARMAETLY